jgi:glyoxylase-like metal-dependent hydrolase (beta-lactamase superfamily II)
MHLNQISPHVYWSPPDPTTDRPILGAVAGERGTLIIDAGNSPAHAQQFQQALAQAGVVPPKFMVLTHWHWDHIFGITAWPLPTFASVETQRKVVELAGLDWSDEALDGRVAAGTEIEFCRDMMKAELPDWRQRRLIPPDIAFTHQVELELGGISSHLIYVGGDHAPDATVVYVPEERILFLGDCLYPNLYHQPPCYTTRLLFPLIDRLLSYEVDYYLEAHNPEPAPVTEMVQYTARLKAIGQEVERRGNDRPAILAALQAEGDLSEDDLELVDYFLAGLDISL